MAGGQQRLAAMESQAGFALFKRVNNRLFPAAEAKSRVRDLRKCRTGQSWCYGDGAVLGI